MTTTICAPELVTLTVAFTCYGAPTLSLTQMIVANKSGPAWLLRASLSYSDKQNRKAWRQSKWTLPPYLTGVDRMKPSYWRKKELDHLMQVNESKFHLLVKQIFPHKDLFWGILKAALLHLSMQDAYNPEQILLHKKYQTLLVETANSSSSLKTALTHHEALITHLSNE